MCGSRKEGGEETKDVMYTASDGVPVIGGEYDIGGRNAIVGRDDIDGRNDTDGKSDIVGKSHAIWQVYKDHVVSVGNAVVFQGTTSQCGGIFFIVD